MPRWIRVPVATSPGPLLFAWILTNTDSDFNIWLGLALVWIWLMAAWTFAQVAADGGDGQ